MRPRKIVLSISASETLLSERTFLLRTRGFNTLRAQTVPEAIATIESFGKIALVLLDLPISSEHRELLTVTLAKWTDVRLLTVRHVPASDSMWMVGSALVPANEVSTEILVQTKILTTLRRGPKPTKKPVQSVTQRDLQAERPEHSRSAQA